MVSTTNLKISFVETPMDIAELMVQLIEKPRDCSILDAGCGKGVFLDALKKFGFSNIEGIELNKELAKYCINKFKKVKIYNQDFLFWNPSKKYDVIIGNPPYLHYNSLPLEVQTKVFALTRTKETDIYHAFIIKAIELLKQEGELIFIVPYGFFYATHAQKVRKKIVTNGHLYYVIDLDEVKLFAGENPETIIFKFVKQRKSLETKTKILRIKTKKATPQLIKEKAQQCIITRRSNDLFAYHEKAFSQDSSTTWSSFPSVAIPKYVLMKSIAYVGVGMVSGFDRAFRIQSYKESFWGEHTNVTFPFIKGEHCKGFWTEGETYYLLLDELVSTEEELKEKFPVIYNYLSPFKEAMKQRYLPKNKKWFHWQALRNFEDFKIMLNQYKIFVPTLDRSTENRFSITKDPVYPSGDVLAIIPQKVDPFFLLGYLNSIFFRNYYYSEGARRGHRISYTQRILSNAKIPLFSKDIREKISLLAQKIVIKRDKSYRHEIDQTIDYAFKNNLFTKGVKKKQNQSLLDFFNHTEK